MTHNAPHHAKKGHQVLQYNGVRWKQTHGLQIPQHTCSKKPYCRSAAVSTSCRAAICPPMKMHRARDKSNTSNAGRKKNNAVFIRHSASHRAAVPPSNASSLLGHHMEPQFNLTTGPLDKNVLNAQCTCASQQPTASDISIASLQCTDLHLESCR